MGPLGASQPYSLPQAVFDLSLEGFPALCAGVDGIRHFLQHQPDSLCVN